MSPRSLLASFIALSLFLTSCSSPAPQVEPTTQAITTLQVTSLPSPTAEAPATQSPEATASPAAKGASSLPNPRGYRWNLVVTGLFHPVDIRSLPGDDRLFVLEQPGRIRIIKNGQITATFLDITDRVGSQGSEQGLLGLAFHPQFAQNGYFYVNYTDQNGDTHIARFTARGDTADANSEQQLIFVKQPYQNHNGGALAFGPDGYLYIGLGDGGSGGDPQGNGQSLNTWLGKILRIDVNTVDTPYGVPANNPFDNIQLKEIWAYGLRNPWRFSFDSATGDLYIGDVGQSQWEEVDYLPAGSAGGANFGWNIMEGAHSYNGSNQPNLTAPVAEYEHGYGCSITGGYVYRGKNLPAWQGVYLYGDFCLGRVWGLLKTDSGWQNALLFDLDASISTFGLDSDGEILLADYSGGSIYRLEPQQ